MRRSCSGIATAGLIGALLLSACTSEGSEPPTEATATESTPVDEPTVDGTDQASWRDEYTASELAAYEAALQRWAEYEVRSEPIWATGKANAEAEALFRQYFPAPNWQAQLEKLQTYEEAQVRVTGLPSVQWSRATRIKIGGTTGSVSITQCVDYLTAELSQYDKPIEKEPVFKRPVLRTIVLGQPADQPWLIYELREPTAKNAKRCDPEDAT